jgi:hypothetical protein
MLESKINTAVKECVAGATAIKVPALPFIFIRDFISKLRPDAGWTASEISEVQTRVIGTLMHQMIAEDEDQPSRPNSSE